MFVLRVAALALWVFAISAWAEDYTLKLTIQDNQGAQEAVVVGNLAFGPESDQVTITEYKVVEGALGADEVAKLPGSIRGAQILQWKQLAQGGSLWIKLKDNRHELGGFGFSAGFAGDFADDFEDSPFGDSSFGERFNLIAPEFVEKQLEFNLTIDPERNVLASHFPGRRSTRMLTCQVQSRADLFDALFMRAQRKFAFDEETSDFLTVPFNTEHEQAVTFEAHGALMAKAGKMRRFVLPFKVNLSSKESVKHTVLYIPMVEVLPPANGLVHVAIEYDLEAAFQTWIRTADTPPPVVLATGVEPSSDLLELLRQRFPDEQFGPPKMQALVFPVKQEYLRVAADDASYQQVLEASRGMHQTGQISVSGDPTLNTLPNKLLYYFIRQVFAHGSHPAALQALNLDGSLFVKLGYIHGDRAKECVHATLKGADDATN